MQSFESGSTKEFIRLRIENTSDKIICADFVALLKASSQKLYISKSRIFPHYFKMCHTFRKLTFLPIIDSVSMQHSIKFVRKNRYMTNIMIDLKQITYIAIIVSY